MAIRQPNNPPGAARVHLRSRRISRGADRTPGSAPSAESTACLAPAMMLYLDPAGDVRPCCKNHVALGNIGRTRLGDIWRGQSRELLEASLARRDFTLGCVQCGAEVDAEGPELAYPSNFERYGPSLAPDRSDRWPLRMEFNLSNSCNLQCIQCNGLLSSSIRLHREGRPPLPKVYGDQFFEDLAAFIPHLVDAQFAGGEPFMAAENYRVWEMIKRLNPGLRCTTVTNATQWNHRVRAVIEDLEMGFVFSIDGVTKETYESVRIGADFDSVMTNVGRYAAIARRNQLPLEVNYCHMVQNYRGLADVLRWAEDRAMHVNVSVVRDPARCSLAAADDEVLHDALRLYESQHDAVSSELALNLPAWEAEVTRLRRWLVAGKGGRRDLWGEPNYVVERRHTRSTRALELFARRAGDRPTGHLRLDEHDRVQEMDEHFGRLVGPASGQLLGLKAEGHVLPAIEANLGGPLELVLLAQNNDIFEADLLVGDRTFRLLSTPLPGLDDVWSTSAVIVEIQRSEVGTPFVDVTDWPS